MLLLLLMLFVVVGDGDAGETEIRSEETETVKDKRSKFLTSPLLSVFLSRPACFSLLLPLAVRRISESMDAISLQCRAHRVSEWLGGRQERPSVSPSSSRRSDGSILDPAPALTQSWGLAHTVIPRETWNPRHVIMSSWMNSRRRLPLQAAAVVFLILAPPRMVFSPM